MRFRAFIDGAARGNPGPAGAGVYVSAEENLPAEEHFEALGHATNNVAEYRALLLALKRAAERGRRRGLDPLRQPAARPADAGPTSRCKAPHLQPLFADALRRAKSFRRFAIAHVPREDNKKADRLANLGADASERAMAGETFTRER